MRISGLVVIILAAAGLAGCATWSATTVRDPSGSAVASNSGTQAANSASMSTQPVKRAPHDPATVTVTEQDIGDRPYETLGDISVTVNKTTIFHPDPTPALVNRKLQETAGAMGADAVIQVRYGTVGISMMSWGSLDGKGRAIAFK